MTSTINLDITKFEEKRNETAEYAENLYAKRKKIRRADVADTAKQQKVFETLAECAYFYHKGIAENNRAITAHTSFGDFVHELTGFQHNEKFGFSTDLLKAAGFSENVTLDEIATAHTRFSSASTVANQGYRWLIPQIINQFLTKTFL